MRRAWTRLALAAAFFCLWTGLAQAFYYYQPTPQGRVGLARPAIGQQFDLEPGERISGVEMWLDGETVTPEWDEEGRVTYTPPAPLAPGLHQVRMMVYVLPSRPGYYYAPVESSFSFTVEGDGRTEVAAPGAEELRALDRVNSHRVSAGLKPLRYDNLLGAAALGHARYLVANPDQVKRDGHTQIPGSSLFFGQTPRERVRYFAYDGGVAEVINFVDQAEEAVDGWIATLYHRISLLHPGMTAMGYGVAGKPGSAVNVVETGPYTATTGLVRWPYDGQVDVPPNWEGAETPDPLALYPATSAPVGYPITLTFGGRPDRLRLTGWSLAGPQGEVEVLSFDPQKDDHLDDTVALIPREPLRLQTTYQVRLRGAYDLDGDSKTFDEVWSFTTAGEQQPLMQSRVVYTAASGELRSVRIDGSGFSPGSRLFLGGLEVRDLTIEADRLSFRLPAAHRGEPSDLLLLTPGGHEALWRGFLSGKEGFALAAESPPKPLALRVGGRQLEQPALTVGGQLLLPAEALQALGAKATAASLPGRTDWEFGGDRAEYTMGRVQASLKGRTLQLGMPVRAQFETTYVDAAFVRALTGAEAVAAGGQVVLGYPVYGQFDISGHWALDAIRRLLADGVVSGFGDGTFRPDEPVTRAGFLKMLVAAKGLPLEPGAARGFAEGDHWVARQGYLGAAVAAGIVDPSEHPGGRFEPDRPIDREAMAVMVVRALGLEESARGQQIRVEGGAASIAGRRFTDAGRWQWPGHVALAVTHGLVTGYAEPDGWYAFRGDRTATRAEAAVMVIRALPR